MTLPREPSSRQAHDLRPMSFELNVNRYAEGSTLVKFGNTHVLVTATIEESVPNWMKGKGTGWITAEYSMLPRSTHTRSKRDREKVSGRTQEIQRLIGRALRAMVDLKAVGERSIMVDCDVLQADGGTRTTSINGGCIAVAIALKKLCERKELGLDLKSLIHDTVAAISIGKKENHFLVDLDYDEDSTCDVDMNFVATGSGKFVEVQGTGEKASFSGDDLVHFTTLASKTLRIISDKQKQLIFDAK